MMLNMRVPACAGVAQIRLHCVDVAAILISPEA